MHTCSDKFAGRVVEVVSGDCLVVKDKASGVERRINLSSIRAPRMGTRDRQPEPYATEAKEFLRWALALGSACLLLPQAVWRLPLCGRLAPVCAHGYPLLPLSHVQSSRVVCVVIVAGSTFGHCQPHLAS